MKLYESKKALFKKDRMIKKWIIEFKKFFYHQHLSEEHAHILWRSIFDKSEIYEFSVDEIQNISCNLGVKDYVAKLLSIKQIKTKDTAKVFFNPSISNLIDPFLMKSMHEAVERLSIAINHNEKIMIYGDYDVDGITSVAMT